jgi:hypothetical protein
MRHHHRAAGTARGRLTPTADLVRLSNSVTKELSALPTVAPNMAGIFFGPQLIRVELSKSPAIQLIRHAEDR